jgi:hypothetical protein
MTSTIWTLGGGAVAADTFLFPHPLNNRRVQILQPETHSFAAKVQELAGFLLSLVPPTCVKDPTPELEACHWLGMALPFPLVDLVFCARSSGWRSTEPKPLSSGNWLQCLERLAAHPTQQTAGLSLPDEGLVPINALVSE